MAAPPSPVPVAPVPRARAANHTDESAAAASYWDQVAREWGRDGASAKESRTWRMVSDAVNEQMLRRWLSPNPAGTVLKTDLFDEVTGSGLVPWLASNFGHVTGVDISRSLVGMARERFPLLHAETADVRSLPFADASFDNIVSNSTLDHLASADDIAVALGELHRVLRRGGNLVVTLDNPVNPVVAVRNALPARLRSASGMVAFQVGATLGPGRLTSLLRATGFEVSATSAVFHCPRLIAVLAGNVIDRRGSAAAKQRFVSLCAAFEGLRVLPTRFLTGYFVAVLARKT